MTQHSSIGGSAASRYIACPGSVALTGALSAHDPGEEAEEDWTKDGTEAHARLEKCLKEGVTPESLGCTETQALALKMALSHCNGQRAEAVRWGSETPVTLPELDPEAFSTVDFWAAGDGWLNVTDYKNGSGVAVDAVNNAQLRYYLLGLLSTLAGKMGLDLWDYAGMFGEFRLDIIQPNSPGIKHTTDFLVPGELRAWFEEVLVPAVRRVRDAERELPGTMAGGAMEAWAEGYLAPGPKQCQFCPVLKGGCPAIVGVMDTILAKAPDQAEDVKARCITKWDYATIARIVTLGPILRKMVAQAEGFALRRLMANLPMPGLKLVPGRNERLWRDGAQKLLEAIYGDDAYTKPELLSPAQVESLAGGVDFVTTWAYANPTSPRLAPIGDSRTAVKRDHPFKSVLQEK